MVIQLGEAEILVGQVTEPFEGLIDGDFPIADAPEQFG